MDEKVFSAVRASIRAVAPKVAVERIVPEATLVELEIDSLRMIDLGLALEANLGGSVFLPDWLSRVSSPDELTVGSLVSYLAEDLAEQMLAAA